MAGLLDEKRYNAAESEKRWAEFWEENKVYVFRPEDPRPVYSVDTPPPYASASHLHVGHAMSYTQAEVLIRYQRMAGKNVFYPMGFDDNGLPTERYVEKKYNINKSMITRPDFIDLCLKETKEVTQTYRTFWKMLGLSVDWSLEYSTISPRAVRVAQSSFRDLWKKGLAVRKEEPIMWDTVFQTALSQADLEVVDQRGMLNFFPFTSVADGAELLIATTRPELLPACVGVFCHPDDERYRHLIGNKARVPLFNLEVPILADDTVDPAFGTGLMMVCTFGDVEDIRKWRLYNLETRVVLNPDGTLNELAGAYAGQKLKPARAAIIEALKDAGLIRRQEQIDQRVSVGERSKSPVEFIPRLQWFIRVTHNQQRFLDIARDLRWFPEFFRTRYDDWVNGLKWDWCISRQRFYGVPMPIWYCRACSEIIVAGADQIPLDPTVVQPTCGTCPACGSKEFDPEHDVFDTWMTSSLTHMINAGCRLNERDEWVADRPLLPMSVRVQGFEIIRTWLFYTMVKGEYHYGELPWRDAVISGWGLDSKGRKISKSLGNYEDPSFIVTKYSADALRYWASQSMLGYDHRYDETTVKNGQSLVTKIFNATRFLVMNLGEDFVRAGDPAQRLPADDYLVAACNNAVNTCTARFEQYDYAGALREAEHLFRDVFCDNYLEMVKYRLRTSDGKGDAPVYSDAEILAGQQTAFDVLLASLKILAPFLPFITEHLYQGFFRKALGLDAPISLHVAAWPQPFAGNFAEAARYSESLEAALPALRAAKLELHLSMVAKVRGVTLIGPQAFLERCMLFKRELISAIRASEIGFEESEEIKAIVNR